MIKAILKTVCPRDCYDTCFQIVSINKKGKIVSVKGDSANPITNGFLCPRGNKDHERVYQNRVLYPYFRENNKLNKVSWDFTLELIVRKLKETLNRYGPEKVLHIEFAGNIGLLTLYFPLRFWNFLGATQTDNSLCSKSGNEALSLHYGLSYGIQPDELIKQKLIVFWGFNAAVSSSHQWSLAQKARKQGSSIIVVDPRRSKSAKNCDVWLNPKPGSDVALAFGVIKSLLEQEWIDKEFISKWTSGYNQLRNEIDTWSYEKIESITGLKWITIEKFAESYSKSKPNVTMIGIGLQKNFNGADSVRAISLIPAMLGIHRGFFYSNNDAYSIDFASLTGEKKYNTRIKSVSQVELGQQIQKGDFKFIYCYNMNPAVSLPNQRVFREGLQREDVFFVVHETHWTKTTDFANVVLPAPTYLEKTDLVIPWSHRYIQISNEIIKPLGESKDEVWVARNLTRMMGWNEKDLFGDPWKEIQVSLQNAFVQGTFEDLFGGKSLALKIKPMDFYPTESGKIELYSLKALQLGLDPLPSHQRLELNEKEFFFTSSALSKYTHTQFQEIYGNIPDIVHINEKDASDKEIKSGDRVFVHNSQGKVELTAEVSSDQPCGTLWSPKLLVDRNNEPLNLILPNITQKIGNGPIFNSTIVKIEKRE